MTLVLVNPGDTFSAQVINQAINVLEQPTGGQEIGRYRIEGSAYNASAIVSCPVQTLSRNASPVSLSIDTSDVAPSNLNTPSTGHLTQGGGQIFASATGIAQECKAAGVYTMSY